MAMLRQCQESGYLAHHSPLLMRLAWTSRDPVAAALRDALQDDSRGLFGVALGRARSLRTVSPVLTTRANVSPCPSAAFL